MCGLPFAPFLTSGHTAHSSSRSTKAMHLLREAPRVFIGDWSLPSTHQNPTLPDGKHVSSTNHTVCTRSLGIVNRPDQSGKNQNTPQLRGPRHQPGPTVQAGSVKDTVVTHFRTHTWSCRLQYSHHSLITRLYSVVNTATDKYTGKRFVSHV